MRLFSVIIFTEAERAPGFIRGAFFRAVNRFEDQSSTKGKKDEKHI